MVMRVVGLRPVNLLSQYGEALGIFSFTSKNTILCVVLLGLLSITLCARQLRG